MITAFNVTSIAVRAYSPIILALEWSRMGRLIFMVCCTSIGTIMNGFFVAAFFVERSLRKTGNVFHACVGLADLIITTGIIPSCAVVLLSGEWDIMSVCYVLHFLAISSTYCYNVFSMLVAVETYYRICRPSKEYTAFMKINIGVLVVSIFIICFVVAGIGVYLDYDYNYCTRTHYGNFYFRTGTAIVFHVIPFFLTLFGLISAAVEVRRRARKQVQYKRSHVFEYDSSSITLNITAYLFFVVAWIPYLVIVYEFPNSSDTYFYQCVWIGLGRSVLSSFLYGFFNRNFRRAFAHLFNYCCCKNTLSTSYNSRHRRTLEYRVTTGEIRVHIMHQAINTSNPLRNSCSSRDTQESIL